MRAKDTGINVYDRRGNSMSNYWYGNYRVITSNYRGCKMSYRVAEPVISIGLHYFEARDWLSGAWNSQGVAQEVKFYISVDSRSRVGHKTD